MSLPKTQRAVQLVGPDELKLNNEKAVHSCGPEQVLCRIEAVGLCFSDLKLLKQFTQHGRKSPVVKGMEKSVLDQIPSYVPNEKPTVPGHEAVVRVVEVGSSVKGIKTGSRFLVQTDYRWLPTENSNAAFGYNFEGALQEYVLMDQRVITSPAGQSMLIPASEKLSASAIALIEPWACVEDAYAATNRTTIKTGGKMLVAADKAVGQEVIANLFAKFGRPGQITSIGISIDGAKTAGDIDAANEVYDDILYFGSSAQAAEKLFAKLAPGGLINIVLCGGQFERELTTPVGKVHYGGIRIIGTAGTNPCDSMAAIPKDGEIRKGDKINVVGAGGPMGVMHVIRNLCSSVQGITVYAGDLDDNRLGALTTAAGPIAKANAANYVPYNPKTTKLEEKFNYISIMAPVPALVAAAVKTAAGKGIINIFAGIPATVSGQIDMNAYINNQLFFIGTSGSVIEDMIRVLSHVESGRLDTNLSVAAISGLEGAVDGIRAVEKALIPGKIIVYPQCKGLGLVELGSLSEKLPQVAAKLKNGMWTRDAETALLESFAL